MKIPSLREVEAKLVEEATECVRQGRWHECEQIEKRLASIRTLQKPIDRSWRQVRWAVLGLILGISLMLWRLHIAMPVASAGIEANSVSLAFAMPSSIDINAPLRQGRQSASGMSRMVLTQATQDGVARDVVIPGGRIAAIEASDLRFTTLRLGKASAIEVTLVPVGCVNLTLRRGRMTATLTGATPFWIQTGRAPNASRHFGEILVLEASENALPPRIVVCPQEGIDVHLRNLITVSFEVSDSQSLSGPQITSSIVKGNLIFSQTDTKLELNEFEALRIDNTDVTADARLRIESTAMRFQFSGRAAQFQLRAGGASRDIRPSILLYLLHNRSLAALVGGFGMLWGAIWGLIGITRGD